ncbi:type II toxin-antitoxin system RelE/ParE family toxin [Candidatus Pacearchaeota archaeon]|nr:type II toxin-antitoxin system RelE/ParE family toxin [Candidatus Pacearchaeota archaeon]
MSNYEIRPNLQRILKKLFKKDNQSYERIIKKIQEIINANSIEHYKNLRHDLKNFKRVQIGEKVLIFNFDKKNDTIIFEDFDHHDKIYLKKF